MWLKMFEFSNLALHSYLKPFRLLMKKLNKTTQNILSIDVDL